MKIKYSLKGLDCAHCAQKIEDQLNKLDFVNECNIAFATTTLFLDVDENIFDEGKIKQIIHSIEPDVELVSVTSTHESHGHEHHHSCSCDHEHSHHHDHHHDDCDCGCQHDHHDDHVETIHHGDLKNAINININGLDCAHCAMKVEQEINKMNEVEDAMIIFSTETLKVKLNKEMSDDELLKRLKNVIDNVESGITLSMKKDIKVIEKPKLFVCKDHVELIIGTIIYIVGIVLGGTKYDLFIFGIAYLLIGYKVLFKALKNIKRGQIFDENFLMCIATIGAFCISDYKEAIAVMLFYSIGEIFQAYAVNKTRTSISSLMDIKSEYANLVVDDTVKQVAPEEVKIDDIILVKPGEKVPLDGIIVNGNSSLDTSSLTGETLPRNVDFGDEVLAGVVNLTGVIKIRVSQVYENSTVSKILDLVENAASKKAPIEQFITKFAKVYTPTVVFLAVALAVIPMFIFKDAIFNDWLYRALTFLVVSCPCALVISIPLGLYAGLGKASRVGALIKGGNYLELLKDIDTIVFDKTGTLTEGSFEVVEVNGSNNLLMIGAYGEKMSNHPIARSIVEKYGQEIDQSRISDFKEIAGKGIEVKIDNDLYHLGNKSYIEGMGYQVTNPITVGTVVHITCNDEYLGNIVVADKIKDTAITGIERLKQSGIKDTVMLTGDRKEVAKDIANKVGIDHIYSELLPQDKVIKVEELIQENRKVAFVGDGINDAPVLARADLGIAMGGVGSDAAIEAADIVLMNDDIDTIGEAVDISKRTNLILKQNVIFTLIIKIGVLILTMFGLSNMWMGVFADVGVTLIAILNSMRILR